METIKSWYKTAYPSLPSIYLHLMPLYVGNFTQKQNKIFIAKTVVIYSESFFAIFRVNAFRNYKINTWCLIF
jgi:hypothetical protein